MAQPYYHDLQGLDPYEAVSVILDKGVQMKYNDWTVFITSSSAYLLYQSPSKSDGERKDKLFLEYIGKLLRAALEDDHLKHGGKLKVHYQLPTPTTKLLEPLYKKIGDDEERINSWLKLVKPRAINKMQTKKGRPFDPEKEKRMAMYKKLGAKIE